VADFSFFSSFLGCFFQFLCIILQTFFGCQHIVRVFLVVWSL